MSKLNRWLRTFHTVRHLQPRQAWYFFLRRVIGANKISSSLPYPARRKNFVHPLLELEHADCDYSDYSFTFLNRTESFSRDAMNWRPQSVQRLWRYNLHYFDFLRDAARPKTQKIALIDDWIIQNPQGSEPAWEPYTASLRIVNWCLFFWSLPQNQIEEKWLRSLYLQACWLERNLELHILANHYFENIKAMLFAAVFFQTADSARWLKHFQAELIHQLAEQTLADGGHYERSPQYHSILLEDYLDIYALLTQNTNGIKRETIDALEKTIDSGLKYLSALATPDDDIPLFNDSASGVASRPSVIIKKARALGFETEIPHTLLIDLPDSGLYGWKCGGDYFLIDCGDIGPAYQPGHTHCDFLSYVLMLDGQWIVVDSGVCEYEPGLMRSYARSTAAHNTVVVDNSEQSEIWGEFRVGRRARRLQASIQKDSNKIVFTGAYRGFPTLKSAIVHNRTIELTLSNEGCISLVKIQDRIEGHGSDAHLIDNLLHLHPNLDALDNGSSLTIRQRDKFLALIEGLRISSRKNSWHSPQFGLKFPNAVLQNSLTAKLPAEFSYSIKKFGSR